MVGLAPEIVITISSGFLCGGFILFQVVISGDFTKRFKVFNLAAQKEINKGYSGIITSLSKLKNAPIEDKVRKLEAATEILYIIPDLQNQLLEVGKKTVWAYLLFLAALLSGIIQLTAYITLDPAIPFWCLILGILYSATLGKDLFDLNATMMKYESGKTMKQTLKDILAELAEEEE
ncbi:MAG: hypothetical protein WC861_00175 [Candidatus Micrarchaeia archaeon]|jgi:hypothetical protein